MSVQYTGSVQYTWGSVQYIGGGGVNEYIVRCSLDPEEMGGGNWETVELLWKPQHTEHCPVYS